MKIFNIRLIWLCTCLLWPQLARGFETGQNPFFPKDGYTGFFPSVELHRMFGESHNVALNLASFPPMEVVHLDYASDHKAEVSADGKRIAIMPPNRRKIEVWDLRPLNLISVTEFPRAISSLHMSPDGTWFLIQVKENRPKGESKTQGKHFRILPFITKENRAVKSIFSSDSRFAAIVLNDNVVRVYGVKAPDYPQELKLKHEVLELLFTSNAENLLIVCDRTIYRWNMKTSQVSTLFKNAVASEACRVSADGEYFATISLHKNKKTQFDNTTAQIWKISSRKLIGTSEHSHRVNSVDFSPNSQYVATASFDKTVEVRDVDLGLGVKTYSHDERVRKVQFTADGQQLVAQMGSESALKAVIWDLARDEKSALFGPFIKLLYLGPDGYNVLLQEKDKIALYVLPPKELLQANDVQKNYLRNLVACYEAHEQTQFSKQSFIDFLISQSRQPVSEAEIAWAEANIFNSFIGMNHDALSQYVSAFFTDNRWWIPFPK